MLLFYIILIAVIISAWAGIAERSWGKFFGDLLFFSCVAFIAGGVITVLGSAIAMDAAKAAPVSEIVYEVESLNDVFGDSYKDNDYILFKDNKLVVYIRDIDSGLVLEKKLTSNVQICYTDMNADARLAEYEDDYANPVLQHLFWEQYSTRHTIEIPVGSTIIPYGDMFIKEAK